MQEDYNSQKKDESNETLNEGKLYNEIVVEEKKKKHSFLKFIASIALASLILCTALYLRDRLYLERPVINDEAPNEINKPFEQTFLDRQDLQSRSAIIEFVSPSVVNIFSTYIQQNYFFDLYNVEQEKSSSGSGVIFHENDEKIFIVTNNHVVENTNSLSVSFQDEKTYSVEIVGKDPLTDLAVLSLDKSLFGKEEVVYKVAIFGDSSLMKEGDISIAVGNALGLGKTCTFGYISAKSRNITIEGKSLDVIQTDAAINYGNSGGALINANGEVIGINTAKISSQIADGIGFAIPSNSMKPIVEELLEKGMIKRPYLGIAGKDFTQELSELYNIPLGVYVLKVDNNSTAEQAGLLPGDIITDVDQVKILDMQTLKSAIESKNIGDQIKIRVVRNGNKILNLSGTLQSQMSE